MLPDKNTKPQGGELVDSYGLRSNAVWDAGQGKGLELRVLVLSPRGWLCDLGLPSLGFGFLVYKMTELEQAIPMVLPFLAL